MKKQTQDTLWEVKIEGEGRKFYQFYLISSKKPVFVKETAFGKFQRMLTLSREPREHPELPPVFHISKNQKAIVEATRKMHGFEVHQLTSQYITLRADNLASNFLYEISLFDKKVKSFFRKKYILASSKKEAIQYSKKFKSSHRVKVNKAKKMDCYPLVKVTQNSIILSRSKK